MTLESLERQPDLVDYIVTRNKADKDKGQVHSLYTTWALIIKEEGTDSQRRKKAKERKLTWIRDRSAILFGLAHIAIEQALAEGIFDLDLIVSLYNEAVVGTKYNRIAQVQAEPEMLTQAQLSKIQEYSEGDKKWTIFFTDPEAYKALPQGLIALFAYIEQNARFNIEHNIINGYSIVAERIPPPILLSNLDALFKREKVPTKKEAQDIFDKLTSGWEIPRTDLK